MRFLMHIEDAGSVDELTGLLRRNGIPTFVRTTRGWWRFPTFNEGIYVCIDSQYDDAVALLKNPEHEVSQPIDVEAFDANARSFEGPLLRWAFFALLVIAALFALVVRALVE